MSFGNNRKTLIITIKPFSQITDKSSVCANARNRNSISFSIIVVIHSHWGLATAHYRIWRIIFTLLLCNAFTSLDCADFT